MTAACAVTSKDNLLTVDEALHGLQVCSDDEIKALERYVDEPGQYVDVTPPEVKKEQEKAWKELEESLRKG